MMHIPLLTNMLGLGGAPTPPAGEADAAVDFAQVLGSLPKQAAPVPDLTLEAAPQVTPELSLAVAPKAAPLAAPLATAPKAVPIAAQLATPARAEAAPVLELSPLAILAPALDPAKIAAPGKPAPASGKILPGEPKIAEVEPALAELATVLPGLPTLAPLEDSKGDALAEQDPSEADPRLSLAQQAAPDAASLQSMAAPETKHAAGPTVAAAAAPPERQLANAAALVLPQTQPQPQQRQDKARAAQAATAPVASASVPVAEISIPLQRPSQERVNAPVRLAEIAQPASPVLPVIADTAGTAAEMTTSAPTIEQSAMPEIELATVIDRLVQTRIQSREGRSEVNVPHPDFGRVTLTLSLAEQDRLGVSMPDAPPELRAAVGQAFAPPQRSEQSAAFNASDPSLSGFADSRREAGGSPGNPQQRPDNQRSDQARQDTAAGRKGQSHSQSDERRNAQGRGVLA